MFFFLTTMNHEIRSNHFLEPSSVSMDDIQSFIHHKMKSEKKRKVSSWNKKLSTL